MSSFFLETNRTYKEGRDIMTSLLHYRVTADKHVRKGMMDGYASNGHIY